MDIIFITILPITGVIISFIILWTYKSKLMSEYISIEEHNNAKQIVNNATISTYVFGGILVILFIYYFIKSYFPLVRKITN
jgi:hypothetical protein